MNNIRKATINDALIIAEISISCWKSAYKGLLPPKLLLNRKADKKRINSWKENIANNNNTVLVYEQDTVCGYLWAGPKRDKIDIPYEIYALYVSPQYQRLGIGQDLINEYKKSINNKPFYLYMLKGNAPAAAFYKNIGGKENIRYNKKISIDGYIIEEEIYIFEQ